MTTLGMSYAESIGAEMDVIVGPKNCGCIGSCAHDLPGADPSDASVDYLAGTTGPNGKPIWSADQIASYLNRTGGGWGDTANRQTGEDADLKTVTFGFHTGQQSLFDNGYVFVNPATGRLTAFTEYFQFAAFNAAQQNATRAAMTYWDDLIAISFKESAINDADITFGNLTNSPGTQAYAYLPDKSLDTIYAGQVGELGGDVWVSTSQASNFQLTPGGYGLTTLVHEIGHAIGISHPGAYNAGNGSPNYVNSAEYYQDLRNYTVMSYWNPREIGTRDFNWHVMNIAYGVTPMVHDILAAQKMYGADMTTRLGDTVYGFNSTAARDAYDFTVNKAPTVAIWDAGGNDTIDASGYNTNQEINLNPGSLSSIGGITLAELPSFEQVNANRAAMNMAPVLRATYDLNRAALIANPLAGRLVDNVGIAYGAVIENAVGGGGNDKIIASAVANRIDGGAGIDTVSYRDAAAGVTVSLATNRGTAGDAAGDTFIGIESIEGTRFNDALTGNDGSNSFYDLGGVDTFNGGGGIDTVSYRDAAAGVTASMTTMSGTGGAAAGDRYVSIEALEGTAFADTLTGSSRDDELYGLGGADTLSGGNGVDLLDGGAGDDVLDGGNGNDALYGAAGLDTLAGGNGDDTLFGGDGNDVLDGGTGNDRLNGGAGSDRLTGGAGNDVYAFTNAAASRTAGAVIDIDVITDFRSGQDRIDLGGVDAIAGTAARDAFSWIGSNAFSGAAGELRSYRDGSTFVLAGDVDGDGLADFVIQTPTAITLGDVVLTPAVPVV